MIKKKELFYTFRKELECDLLKIMDCIKANAAWNIFRGGIQGSAKVKLFSKYIFKLLKQKFQNIRKITLLESKMSCIKWKGMGKITERRVENFVYQFI